VIATRSTPEGPVNRLGNSIYQILTNGKLLSLVERIAGSDQRLDRFLVNTQFEGDAIERHNHTNNSFVIVLGVTMPPMNSIPLRVEKYKPLDDVESARAWNWRELKDREVVDSREIVIPRRGVLVMRGEWPHSMKPVLGFRQTIGCFYKDR
jgi:hypothetical protein